MTTEQLVAIAGAILSLLFNFVPGLNTWYAGLSSLAKRLIMIGLLALAAAGSYGASCLGFAPWLGLDLSCDAEGLMAIITLFFEAVVANQAVFLLTPQTAKVRAAKAG